MRKTLARYMNSEDYLLHADMWRFNTNAKVINVGLGEANLLNIASGLAYTGKNVYIYGVCGFIIHRYEQLKFSCRDFGGNYGKIIICNAGRYGYSQFGTGHTLDDDLDLMRLLGISYCVPESIGQFTFYLRYLHESSDGLHYIQLGRDE